MTVTQTKPAQTQLKRLEGKLAIITGASRGIGAAIAERLAAEGAQVVVTYNKTGTDAEKVAADITKNGGKAHAIKADVSNEKEAEALVAQVKKLGKIDILVNNAAIAEGGMIDAIDIGQYQRVFDVNVKGVVATTIAALPQMNDGGRIINISSGAAKAAMAGFSLYSATKAAMESLTRCWAQDLGKRQITVNAIAPGLTVTQMMESAMDKAAQDHYVGKTALGRLGQPVDIADAVAFLASDDARWVTGQSIGCDGGLSV